MTISFNKNISRLTKDMFGRNTAGSDGKALVATAIAISITEVATPVVTSIVPLTGMNLCLL